jgi:hypothetical protein
MPPTPADGNRSRDRKPRHVWVGGVVVCLGLLYMGLQILFVQPYLWPAGHGIRVRGDSRFIGASGDQARLLARPPAPDPLRGGIAVAGVAPESPGRVAGVQVSDQILEVRQPATGQTVDLRPLAAGDPATVLRSWRAAYWLELRGPLVLALERGAASEKVTLERPAAVSSPRAVLVAWARQHVGMMAQICVFILSAAVLLALRTTSMTATLAAVALALCGVGGGGPLSGAEQTLPAGLRELMTMFGWLAAPIAFPLVGLAIAYFPHKAAVLDRWPWLHGLPFLAAAPMIALGLGTAAYLAGADAFEPAAAWDAAHPGIYFGSFAAALGVNVLAIGEGILRYRRNPDAAERRRIRIVVWTAVPGVFAYAIKEGLPIVALLLTGSELRFGWLLRALLQVLVLLPAFGLTVAVAVHRVLAPRVVLRRSIQYALARNTLTLLTLLPVAALAVSLITQRDMTIGMIIAGAPGFYIVTIGLLVVMLRYRDRARTWLDERFFRQEYDARKILLSLATRVRFETDPNDLSALVVGQIDEALHPKTTAILVGGLEEGSLTPVSVLHGSAESLPAGGGLVTMLRWSDEPLEIYLDDPRSPAHRLPQDEQEWLECTGAVLIVPVVARDRSLIAIMALGEKRSEERYTAEDRELLGSIAGQMALGFDVARLRQRATSVDAGAALPGPAMATASEAGLGLPTPVMQCPRCGRCEDASVGTCPEDGTRLVRMGAIPRVVDNKYRIEQLLGRGGMGSVYRARDVRLDRDVALKLVRVDLLGHAEARRRFRREAQIVARLQHPAIVAIFDYGTLTDGGAYLVMELVRGEDLRRLLTREARLPRERVQRLMSAICDAIESAHREGVLHRDLKPENVLMPSAGTEVKVLDFGVAKLLAPDLEGVQTETSTSLTMDGVIVGTPAYMAPEQLRGEALDSRTDVFSLGVMTFEMLTGELPFGKGPLADIVLRQAQGPPGLQVLDPSLPDDLERAVQAALEVDRNRRPATPAAFARLLQKAVIATRASAT